MDEFYEGYEPYENDLETLMDNESFAHACAERDSMRSELSSDGECPECGADIPADEINEPCWDCGAEIAVDDSEPSRDDYMEDQWLDSHMEDRMSGEY